MKSEIIKNLGEMEIFADFFLKKLSKIRSKAVVIGLSGDLGSGKTTFVQNIAKILKIEKYITSPTFVIQKQYEVSSEKSYFKKLIHIDAYRLDQGKDLVDLGWEDLINNPNNIIFLEWPEKVKGILGSDTIYLNFKFIDEDIREIFYEK
ncbi:MAG: tRNA (adenosine(37)-N6)-threonylcarbamoyltransferase complex ATPase subunit type 1 TsaE [Patescibacteria group bacterium]|nr:tRNA (adenosine(37)-N6)-threonylcarbamoyltransferase complex ATPase subunit type 1 TsaE [Patescibacteria group bacterium]